MCDKETVLCCVLRGNMETWEVTSNESSLLLLSPFVLVRMPNHFLTIKHLRVEQMQQRQSTTVKRGVTKLKRVGNLTCLCEASNVKKHDENNKSKEHKFSDALFRKSPF